MLEKVLPILTEKTKDFGLSKDLVKGFAEQVASSLNPEASDEELLKAVDYVVPFAKATQREVTVKTQARKQKEEKVVERKPNETTTETDERQPDTDSPILKQLLEEVKSLKQQQTETTLKLKKAERDEMVKKKAKELHIADELVKFASASIKEDATEEEISEMLTAFKQAIVNNALPTKGGGISQGGGSSIEELLKKDADRWLKTVKKK